MHTQPEAICWMDGRIRPARESSVPVMDHGLLYGDGIFEGIRFYHGQPLLLQEHLLRLQHSARALLLELPCTQQQLVQAIMDSIEAYQGQHGYIRLIVTRGSGPLGIDPYHCHRSRLIIIVDGLSMVSLEKRQQGVRCIIASTRRLPADGLDARIKSLNYLNHILARIEAVRAGADEALLLNHQGKLTEGTADNVFIVKQQQLLTPPCSDGALAGITRASILQLATDIGLDVAEATLAPYDLYTADECFLTGTGAELIPVREIDGRKLTYCPGPAYNELSTAYMELIQSLCQPDD